MVSTVPQVCEFVTFPPQPTLQQMLDNLWLNGIF